MHHVNVVPVHLQFIGTIRTRDISHMLSQFLARMSAMNFLSNILLLAVCCAPSVSAVGGQYVADSGDNERSMIGNVDVDDLADIAQEKEMLRDISIPLLEETPADSRMLRNDCTDNEDYFRLDIKTDEYGFENEWFLKKKKNGSWQNIEQGPPKGRNYGARNTYIGGFCLSPGNYKFIITDLFKDGMCCTFGQGKYTGYLSNNNIFSSPNGNQDWEKRTHSFTVSSSSNNNPPSNNNRPPTRRPTRKPTNKPVLPFEAKINGLAARDSEWLVAHNVRRKEWHKRYGKSYVPLEWSNALKAESRVFAQKLLRDSCGGLYHDKNNVHGENLAANYGSGSWAAVRSADTIVSRWVEDEANDPYPANGHLTQVLWRPSKYVGCAEASKPKDGGGLCHAQVCRYARPGNCNMNSYKTNKKDWWLTPMLMDDSPCSPKCPPDGC